MEITIRKATESDLESILNIYIESGLDKEILPLDKAKKIFNKFIQYPDYQLFVSEFDNKIIGTFALLIMDNLGHLGIPSAVLEDIGISTKLQGKGIGKKMMEYAMQYAKEKGCYKMTLSSNLKRESAHAFYDSLGFKRHGYSFLIEL
jgi:ribosomal protein S18 acetylase RimI-like enzyme